MARLIAVGDIVEVEDSGRCYSTYQAWADKYNLNRFIYGFSIETAHGINAYKVICKGNHLLSSSHPILGLENVITKQQYMYGTDKEMEGYIVIIGMVEKQLEFNF